MARHGLLSRTVDIVPHERTQSVRLTSGPLERALGLATLHLDSTRGPVRTRASNRDGAEARAMLDRQVIRARQARTALGPHAQPADRGRGRARLTVRLPSGPSGSPEGSGADGHGRGVGP